MGEQNNIITREIWIVALWFMEQKAITFRSGTDIRDELARSEPARPGLTRPGTTWPGHDAPTAYISTALKDTGLKIVIFKFHRDLLINSEPIAVLRRRIFVIFTYIFTYNSGNTKQFQNLIILRERTLEDPSESLWFFILEKILRDTKLIFLG